MNLRFRDRLQITHTGAIDVTLELLQEPNHKSINIHFLILIPRVVANGELLLTTGDMLLIFSIVANKDAINS